MFSKFCAYILFVHLGWTIDGKIPRDTSQLLLVCLPHTSYWDFVMAMLFIKAEKIKLTLFVKDGFYFFPFTLAYRYFRVVPIRRNKRNDFVEQAAKAYANGLPLWTGMAPEGTRSKTCGLKSGYYYLAKRAKIPVALVGLDFQKKALVITQPRPIFTSFEEDQADLIKFSRSLIAKRPALSI